MRPVYAWIWRILPFGRPGKIAGSLVLTAAVVALLWFVVFPWAEPILPFDDVQVGTEGGTGGVDPGPGAAPEASTSPGDDFDIPYNEESNNPTPASSR